MVAQERSACFPDVLSRLVCHTFSFFQRLEAGYPVPLPLRGLR